MISLTAEGWIQLFTQMRLPTPFLSRLFTIKPGGIYNGDEVSIDIQRVGEQVAVVVKRCTGPNLNDFDIFTTKTFKPPSYNEGFPLNVCDLINRMAGEDPFSAARTEYAAKFNAKIARGFTLVDAMIVRAIELQASQILQTGILNLTDTAGDIVYTLDFQPKATHFPTVSVSWSTSTADAIGDIESLCEVISADGKVQPNQAILGSEAMKNLRKNDDIFSALDNRKMSLGMIAPQFVDSGVVFQGTLWAGSFNLDLFTYNGRFDDPNGGASTKYIEDDKMIILSTTTRLDMATAGVPLPLGPDPRVAGLIPPRLSSVEGGFDVTPNLFPSPSGKEIQGDLETRTLLIPVQIDGYGCIDTEI